MSVITSQIAGTPAYMAPEQLHKLPLTPSIDVFAWGATIAYAATGRAPFGSDSMAAVVNRILNAPPDLAGLSGPLLELVAACLSKDPAQRPTARQLLLRLLGDSESNESASEAAPTRGLRAMPAAVVSISIVTIIAAATFVVRNLPDGSSGTPPSSSSSRPGTRPSSGTSSSPATSGPATSRPASRPPANVTWLENKLGLTLPSRWKVVRTSSGTHVLTTPSCPNPDTYFGSRCLGFWVVGANEIARGDEGFGSYNGRQRYYPTADVQPCPLQATGFQLSPEKKPIRTIVPVGSQHRAAFTEWIVPCTDDNGKRIGSFTQREWFLPTSQILIIDQTDVVELPGVITKAKWR